MDWFNLSAMENKRKHLEFAQQFIMRMNVNSFLLKGWAVTLVAALFAFAVMDVDTGYIYITFLSTLMFWFLDGFYLSQVRRYRTLYNEIKEKEEPNIDYDMNTSVYGHGRNKWLSSAFSRALLLFYGVLLIVSVIVYFILDNQRGIY